jgi:hypothetical protein
MISAIALVLAFSVAPNAIASGIGTATSQQYVSSSGKLDRVSEKFTARSLAGEFTLAAIPYAITTFDEGTAANLGGSVWLNSDRTFKAEFIFSSADPKQASRSPIRLKTTGVFYLDGNLLRLVPKTDLFTGDRLPENISTHEIEFVISPNGQVLQQAGRAGIFLVKK